MVLKADQERVMTLLRDTITLLCKNGLNFKSQFCVDAVIGVTVDENDLFYVSVKEIVKSEHAKLRELEDKSDVSTDDSGGESISAGNREHRRKRRKKRVKTETGESGDEDPGGYGSGQGEGSPNKKVCVKKEAEEEVPSDEDIVFIKQELDDNSWSHSQDMSQGNSYGDYSQNNAGMGGGMQQPGDQNFSSLSDMTLVPMDNSGMSSNNSGMWNPQQQQQQQQRRPYVPRGPRSTTVTSTGSDQQLSQQQPGGPGQMGMGDPNLPQQAGQQQQVDTERITCPICNLVFSSKYSASKHINRHYGNYRYSCDICSKGFSSSTLFKAHMFVHTGVKEFSCNICSKGFGYKHVLKIHMRNVHGVTSGSDGK